MSAASLFPNMPANVAAAASDGNNHLLSEIVEKMNTLVGAMNTLNSTERRKKRDPEEAVYTDGACPTGLVACDVDEQMKYGRTCPDMHIYAPDPLIVDSKGRVCYAPESLEKWFGQKQMSIEAMIEMLATELFAVHMQSPEGVERVKKFVLDANMKKVTHPTLLDGKACRVINTGNGPTAIGCTTWDVPVVAKGYDVADLNEGLKEAVDMYNLVALGTDVRNKARSDPTTWKLDYVFHRYDKPWLSLFSKEYLTDAVKKATKVAGDQISATADAAVSAASKLLQFTAFVVTLGYVRSNEFSGSSTAKNEIDNSREVLKTALLDQASENYKSAVNPATLAYAGAYAWAVKSDQMYARMGTRDPKFLATVQKLPSVIAAANGLVYKNLVEKGNYHGLQNLTFDVAWPMIMDSRIRPQGIVNACSTVTQIDGVTPEEFAKKPAKVQWDLIIRQYKKSKP